MFKTKKTPVHEGIGEKIPEGLGRIVQLLPHFFIVPANVKNFVNYLLCGLVSNSAHSFSAISADFMRTDLKNFSLL